MTVRVPNQLKEAAKAAKAAGWVITNRGNSHLCWVSPDGARITTSGSDIACGRTAKNYIAELRRAGLVVSVTGSAKAGRPYSKRGRTRVQRAS